MKRQNRNYMDNTHTWGRMLLKPLVCPEFSKLAGKFLDTGFSAKLVPSFIKSNHIDMSSYEKKEYGSFNDFFARKINPEARTFSPKDSDFISPCDCYASAYSIHSNLHVSIKDTSYTVTSLLVLVGTVVFSCALQRMINLAEGIIGSRK